jgi:hypothetical protein
MPNTLFAASRLKIKRAEKHVHELEDLVAAYFAEKWHETTFAPNPETGVLHLDVAIMPRPPEMGAVLGDAIHNLRAALDLMAVDLIRYAEENTKSVYFPFAETEDDLELMIKKRNFDPAP